MKQKRISKYPLNMKICHLQFSEKCARKSQWDFSIGPTKALKLK